jgi:hypothetical protein
MPGAVPLTQAPPTPRRKRLPAALNPVRFTRLISRPMALQHREPWSSPVAAEQASQHQQHRHRDRCSGQRLLPGGGYQGLDALRHWRWELV